MQSWDDEDDQTSGTEDGQHDANHQNNDFTKGMDHPDNYEKVKQAYGSLISRRVDLVGDYAGSETFIIEGDSMLLHCFDDAKLDFGSGFQLLHAVYNVEQFLLSLVERKCQFRILFFENNKQLCVPARAQSGTEIKYLLARAVIIRHLSSMLQTIKSTVTVTTFESWESPDFLQHLQKSPPYFLMVHNGLQTREHPEREDEGTSQTPESSQQERFQSMIISLIQLGFNLALVNELECRDTKVMTVVLEAQRKMKKFDIKVGVYNKNGLKSENGLDSLIEKLSTLPSSLSERQRLAVLTVCDLLDHTPEETSTQEWRELCSAFLLHQAILVHTPLDERSLQLSKQEKHYQQFICSVAASAESILQHSFWPKFAGAHSTCCDVADFVDGRLLTKLLAGQSKVSDEMWETHKQLTEAVVALGCSAFSPKTSSHLSSDHSTNGTSNLQVSNATVLPFANAIFDKHLESVHVKIGTASTKDSSPESTRIFKEISHWHNAKNPLGSKGNSKPRDPKQAFWADKRNQLFMAEMQRYAASLTNAVGRSLDPETVVAGTSSYSQPAAKSSLASNNDVLKKGPGGKTAVKNAAKKDIMDRMASDQAKKADAAADKAIAAWRIVCQDIERSSDVSIRYEKTRRYLSDVPLSSLDVVGSECELYMVNCLLLAWIEACRADKRSQNLHIAALIWNHLLTISRRHTLPKCIMDPVARTVDALKLPPILPMVETGSNRKLTFAFALAGATSSLSVGMSSKDFQLLHCGPYLERSFDSKPDPRVDFQPDGWQRSVLDSIDKDESVFVVAPTSAGKTFISFYAMRKVLEGDDQDILVYVAPTKALVNQIAAEIQARYSKRFKFPGKSVWAIHTRDYRINNPNGCQILVTVPHILQIMLMAPSNAGTWSSRIKRIIFDEIHSIGQAEDGVVWEQLLLMTPCPIIALSATVGNPQEFGDWLSSTQEAVGHSLVTIQHPYRYSDLRKYYYNPPRSYAFAGLPQITPLTDIGLDDLPGLNYIHPVAALVDKSRGIPEDLALEPRDCLYLWQAMTKVQDKQHPVPSSLDPRSHLPAISRKVDILEWEKQLKNVLQIWLEDATSPYDRLLREIEQTFRDEKREDAYITLPNRQVSQTRISDPDDYISTSMPLLCRLHEQGALPAIMFNYDRHICEKTCRSLLKELTDAETALKKSGPQWKRTLEEWEQWKKRREQGALKLAKTAVKKQKKNKDDDDEKGSKLDSQKESGSNNDDKWLSFDPDAPLSEFSFADYSQMQASELDDYIQRSRLVGRIPDYLIHALKRGVGVHHAGMNRKYRQMVEILFRKRFLRIIIATGTLALGINMPCKTVVFSGDSVYLTALNYRQCAGRGGRRGFDLLGNVVFHGISRQKVCRLISSRLPDLTGHFPITTSLVLRMFSLLHESKDAEFAVTAINSILSQPRLYLGGPNFKDQTMHHLRFSIEYLRRQHLLGANGIPLNFAGLVGHLYYTENSSFAFHALLKEGYFGQLCAGIHDDKQNVLESLMLIMSHLFKRIPCQRSDAELREKAKSSPSIICLPSMPERATKILQDHNAQTLQVFKTYVKTFVEQHIQEPDNILPLTKMKIGTDATESSKSLRSAFVSLSGAGDDFDSIHDLCSTVRSGVFLEEAVIPYLQVYPQDMDAPLNSYLLDFYKHGNIVALERDNGVRRSDIWFHLNDFSLVLATIVTSLSNFMKLSETSDIDMLDLQGEMDILEETQDDLTTTDQDSIVGQPQNGHKEVQAKAKTKVVKKKTKVQDSWDDSGDESEQDESAVNGDGADDVDELSEELEGWNVGDGKSLLNILKAFQQLHAEFNVKFKAMWA